MQDSQVFPCIVDELPHELERSNDDRVPAELDLLDRALATEVVAWLTTEARAAVAHRAGEESLSALLHEQARAWNDNVRRLTDRIESIGGVPDLRPDGLGGRSVVEHGVPRGPGAVADLQLSDQRTIVSSYRIWRERLRDGQCRALLEDLESSHRIAVRDLERR